MFYLRLPLTSDSIFIVFFPGLLQYSYDKNKDQNGPWEGGGGWAYIGRRGRDKGDRIEFKEGGHGGRGGQLGAGRGGRGGR